MHISIDKARPNATLMFMSKSSLAAKSIPIAASNTLKILGENLRIARKRRKRSLRAWSKQIDASVPTIRRMEKGDPTVGMGVYVTAMFLTDGLKDLSKVSSPDLDTYALNLDILEAVKRR